METILLVDDNKYVLEALALTLRAYTRGYAILKAKDGREAADILDRMPVALVLTDLEMPGMNGYKLIEHINRLHPSIPVLVMTGDASPSVAKRLEALGVAHCIEKPFDYDEVSQQILSNLTAGVSLAPATENPVRFATA